jgi:hypothetical protein
MRFPTTYQQVILQCTSSALRFRGISKIAIKNVHCIDILENTYNHAMYPKKTIRSLCLQHQRLPAIKYTSRNSPAQMVALQEGATSLHVYAPAPRRGLRPSPLRSPSCRGALRISVVQKARFARV